MSGGEGAVDQGDIRLSIPIQVLLGYTKGTPRRSPGWAMAASAEAQVGNKETKY